MDQNGRRLIFEFTSALRGRPVRDFEETLEEARQYAGGQNRMEQGGENRAAKAKKAKAEK
jgi:hypothetical protein